MKYIVLYSNNAIIPIDEEKAGVLQKLLLSENAPKFVQVGERDAFIATASIAGIFSEDDIGDWKSYKSGKWVCKYGVWHSESERTKSGGCLCNQYGGKSVDTWHPENKIRLRELESKLSITESE